jgi:DNA excision repair protein ERCC-2
MIININGIKIYFPYKYIYPEQYEYIKEVINSLSTPGHILIEMPSGTGKTVALLSATVSYQMHVKKKLKIVYCSRTVGEINKALDELKKLNEYIKKYEPVKFLGLGLTSKKILCVNEKVLKSNNVDLNCKRLLDKEECGFYENLKNGSVFSDLEDHKNISDKIHNHQNFDSCFVDGVYDINDLINLGKKNNICPYYFVRKAINECDCIIYTYNYLIDPRIYGIVSKDLGRDCIVIFDEAHNIDSHCIEALTFEIRRHTLDSSTRSLKKITNLLDQQKKLQKDQLVSEYQKIKGTLKGQVEDTIPYFYSNAEKKYEFVPGNLRDSFHFVGVLKRFVEFLKTKLKTTHLTTENPNAFCQSIRDLTFLDKRTLKFCSQRLGTLLQSLNHEDEDIFNLKRVADFGTMLAMYSKGFSVIFEPYDSQAQSVFNPVLRLACLDSSIAISQIFTNFNNVIITSGTLSPIEMYPKILNFVAKKTIEIGASLERNSISPLFVTKGNDQMTIKSTNEDAVELDLKTKKNSLTTSFSLRSEPSVVRNYGNLIIELSKSVPDGIICFFPSYLYMEEIVSLWSENNTINEVAKNKLVFIESPDYRETELALKNYKKACENGRGAIMFCVARGKVSEGVDFEDGYGRCVAIIGVPFQYTESIRLKKRLDFLRNEYNINEYEFLTFDAMRHAAQCLGRVLRNKQDYGLMILADQRFEGKDKKEKLPKWIQGYIEPGNCNLSVDMALSISKRFFREMAQKLPEKGVTMLDLEDIM